MAMFMLLTHAVDLVAIFPLAARMSASRRGVCRIETVNGFVQWGARVYDGLSTEEAFAWLERAYDE
jgi:hypothetical protein